MAGTFTAIDLSQLPAPDVIERLDFETILAETLAEYLARDPDHTAPLESDPAYKILEVAAYRELLLRQRVNDAARGVMLAYAEDGDLDQIGANFNVRRLLIQPADPTTIPPTPAVWESNADYRRRIQLSFEGFTTAGSEGSYVFHGLSAAPDVKDVAAVSPQPGVVTVYVLSRTGNGEAPANLLDSVDQALNAENTRPMTDQVVVQSASIVPYTVEAELVMYPGPDSALIRQTAEDAVRAHVDSLHRIGHDVSLSGIYAALHRPGVQRVNLVSPAANLVIDNSEAAFCTSIAVTAAGAPDV